MTHPRIAGIGTAVPEHVVAQESVRDVVHALFQDRLEGLDRLLEVFNHLHVRRRHFAQPLEWYGRDRGWKEFTEAYTSAALDLSLRAAQQALEDANTSASELKGIVVASTTGIRTPSLDAVLMQKLGMGLTSLRLPVFGLGCAGGVAGLARTADLFRATGGPYLFIAVEVCSATFQKNDTSKSNLIGTSLFADGAGAVVLSDNGTGPEVRQGHSTLFADTEDIMGWDVTDTGLKVRFSRDIPTFVRTQLPLVITQACQTWGVDQAELRTFVTHPGGQRVLEAYADAVGRPLEAFEIAFDVLQDHGNMSSASVLFVLAEMLRQNRLEPGYALMSALGPGFSSEQLLLRVP